MRKLVVISLIALLVLSATSAPLKRLKSVKQHKCLFGIFCNNNNKNVKPAPIAPAPIQPPGVCGWASQNPVVGLGNPFTGSAVPIIPYGQSAAPQPAAFNIGDYTWSYGFWFEQKNQYQGGRSAENLINGLRHVLSLGWKMNLWIDANLHVNIARTYDKTGDQPHVLYDCPNSAYLRKISAKTIAFYQFIAANLQGYTTSDVCEHGDVAPAQPAYNPNAWINDLRGHLRAIRDVVITIYGNGQFCVTLNPQLRLGARVPTITFIWDNRVPDQVQTYNWLLNFLGADAEFSRFLPRQVNYDVNFTEDSDWWVAFVNLLKRRRWVDIIVESDGQIIVQDSARQTGQAGYTLITNINTVQTNTPQYEVLFRLRNWLNTRQTQINQYTTVTTTTVSTSTNQVNGGEAFLNQLASLLKQNRQFTIVIDNKNTYQVNENKDRSGSIGFFTVVYSTATPTKDQKTAWTRLYELLKSRADIIKFDRTNAKQVDPFNAVISTSTTTTTTTTKKVVNGK
jgi:hypothetical protein